MPSYRIYELAKKNKISSKELLDICLELGFEAKSHMSVLDSEQVKKVLKVLDKKESNGKKKSKWEEEKKINIRKVLDRELDREEKEGRLRRRVTKRKDRSTVNEKGKNVKVLDKKSGKQKVERESKIRPDIKKVIELPEGVSAKQLSERINIPSNEIIQTLFNMGEVISINLPLGKDLIEFLSHEYNFKYRFIDFEERLDDVYKDNEKDVVIRPPIVTVMGHVDHGKTTLLDVIRKTKVAVNEVGGITQQIGAYQVEYNSRKITFIDTPGHEAFTTMRARGAKVTDIAVIVIAADDGIMPQTVEAIDHAREAKVPIIIAINKIDLPGADPSKVKKGLTEYNLVPEEWGGDTICVEISAKNKINIEELLEMILLVADLNEIKGNPNTEGSGVIIESRLDKGMGPIGTVIVRRGTIRVGDFFVTGNSWGRVRSIKNEEGKVLKEASLSEPVEILGFPTVPKAGDKFFVVRNERVSKELINKRNYEEKLSRISTARRPITLEDLSDLSKEDEIKSLKIVLKADSNGSLDAVEQALNKIKENKVKINLIHKAVGAISESDILLASASNAIVVGFGVVPTPNAKSLAKKEGIDIRTYNIIYNLIDDIKLAFKGLLEPKIERFEKGKLEVREIFKIPKVGAVAGCYVLEGEVARGDILRVISDGRIIYESKIATIHRFKDDVKKVSTGFECGVRIENFQDVNKGDILEIFEEKEVKE